MFLLNIKIKSSNPRVILLTSRVSPYLNFDFLVTEQRHQMRDDAGVDDHLDLLVAGVCQVGQSPHCVYQNLETAKKNNEEMNIFC